MVTSIKGRCKIRVASSFDDVFAAQTLRYKAFSMSDGSGLDNDTFDDNCKHILIEDLVSGKLVCCFRMLDFSDGSEIKKSYSAQYYELSALCSYKGKLLELGRFCVHPDVRDPDVLRAAWGAMTNYVDKQGIDFLFGCVSFKGTNAELYKDAFAMLREYHLAPRHLRPCVKAPNVFKFAAEIRGKPDKKVALHSMPPLLKTYLKMGGWVSDHAVIDNHMNTLHVFTGVEINSIPLAWKRFMRALA